MLSNQDLVSLYMVVILKSRSGRSVDIKGSLALQTHHQGLAAKAGWKWSKIGVFGDMSSSKFSA